MPERESQSHTIRGKHDSDPPLFWRMDAAEDDPTLPLIVGLHGWGMSEDSFARSLRGLIGGRFRVLLPRASLPLKDRKALRNGSSWYDYDGDQDRFRAELIRCERLLLDFLHGVEREQGLEPKRRWLLGFSQGGYCGSWIALRNPEIFDGMVICGARVKTEFLADEMPHAAMHGFKALLCHGNRDHLVLPEAAVKSHTGLAGNGIAVELRSFDRGHSLGEDQVDVIRNWLTEHS